MEKVPKIGKDIVDRTKKIIAEVPKIRFYAHTISAWDAMYKACSNARKSIYIEMYVLDSDTRETHDFVELFKAKVAQGVKVVLLLDALGSSSLESDEVKALRQAGVEVKFFIKWLTFTHRKLLIVDEQKVYVGGVNIKKNFIDWVDLMLSFDMQHAGSFLKSFAGSYALAGGTDPEVLAFNKKMVRKNPKFGIIDHIPLLGYFRLKKYFQRKIGGACHSITLVTPYLVLPGWLEDALRRAVERGVKVSIIIPELSDVFLTRITNKYFLKKLSAYGVEIHLLSYMNHAKTILVDDKEAMVGSGNIDNLSLGRNSEIGVFFSEPEPVAELKEILEKWRATAKEYHPDRHSLKWYEKLSLPILWVFFPFI